MTQNASKFMSLLVILSGLVLSGCTGAALPLPTDDFGDGVILGTAESTQRTNTSFSPCIDAGDPTSPIEQAMFEALNAYRVENGLKPLIYSRTLAAAGRAHLQDMAARNYFSHITPEGDDPGARAIDLGFCHKYVGENLAAGQSTPEAAMQAWKNSASHDVNMREPDYIYVGMAVYQAPNGRLYWAQEFAFDLPELASNQ